ASPDLAGSAMQSPAPLVSEELGAVLPLAESDLSNIQPVLERFDLGWTAVGRVEPDDQLTIYNDDEVMFSRSRAELQRAWSEMSFRLQSLRDNPETARQEFNRILDDYDPGLNVRLTFDMDADAGPRAP